MMSFKDENQVPKNKVIALDPGVRTFQTGYDRDGQIVHIGASDISRIYRLCRTYDEKQSQQTSVNHQQRYKMRKHMKRIYHKIKNLIKDVHCKLAKFLVVNYNHILPQKVTQRMQTENN